MPTVRLSGTRTVETPWASQKNQLATACPPKDRNFGGIIASNSFCSASRSGLSRNRLLSGARFRLLEPVIAKPPEQVPQPRLGQRLRH